MARRKDFSHEELVEPAVIVAPHQDDEVLGCGGTIILKKRAGAAIDIVFLSDGRNSHSHLVDPEWLADIRRGEALKAASILGVTDAHVHFLGFPDGSLRRHAPAATPMLAELLRHIGPRQIFVPCRWDFPPDHLAARSIGLAATASMRPMTVYEYPVWFWNHWPMTSLPRDRHEATKYLRNTYSVRAGLRQADFDRVVAIDHVLSQKRAALEAHATQMSRYIPDEAEWKTLAHIGNGRFLAAFYQPFECFIETRLDVAH